MKGWGSCKYVMSIHIYSKYISSKWRVLGRYGLLKHLRFTFVNRIKYEEAQRTLRSTNPKTLTTALNYDATIEAPLGLRNVREVTAEEIFQYSPDRVIKKWKHRMLRPHLSRMGKKWTQFSTDGLIDYRLSKVTVQNVVAIHYNSLLQHCLDGLTIEESSSHCDRS